MITSTLFFIFLFLSLVSLAISVLSRSPLLAVVAGLILLFSSFSALAGGVKEYDGSYNRTTNFTATTNQTLNWETANYVIVNDMTNQAIMLICMLGGVGFMLYGLWTPRPVSNAPVE